MKSGQTYFSGRVLEERTGATRALRAALLAAALLGVLVFAAYVALNLTSMAQTLHAMRGDLGRTNQHLSETNARLAKMTHLLANTESHMRVTNADLKGTLTRLDASDGLLFKTNGALGGMGRELHTTNGTLREMAARIDAMTRKITHAKLLF